MPTENESLRPKPLVIRVAQQQQERPASRLSTFPDLLPKTDHFQGPLRLITVSDSTYYLFARTANLYGATHLATQICCTAVWIV